MAKFHLKVNGREHDVDVPEDMPLLWAIRDVIGLTGTKYGCGIAECGACTVHLDGEPTRSCVTPVSAVGTAEVTTIEGLSSTRAILSRKPGSRRRCRSAATASRARSCRRLPLLKKGSAVTDEDINRAMEGNLCRCGTYDRIRRAIRRAVMEG